MIRYLPLLLVVPQVALAEDFAVRSQIASATLFYPAMAEVQRQATVALPEGRHRIIVPDIPLGAGGFRFSLEGAVLGAVTVRETAQPPQDLPEPPDLIAARDEVERLTAALRRARDNIREIELRGEAAELQLSYLRALSAGEDPVEADALGAVLRQVGGDALAALQAAHRAKVEARDAALALDDQEEALDQAKAALAALIEETEDRIFIGLNVTAETAGEVTLGIRYLIDDAGWRPVYDVTLVEGDAPRLDIAQAAKLYQSTGENWRDVALSLSTASFFDDLQASEIWSQVRRIAPPQPQRRVVTESAMVSMDEPIIEAPIIVEEVGIADPADVVVTYRYPSRIDLASNADEARVSLGTVTTAPAVFARATPRHNATAFRTVSFVNDTGAPLLPSDEVTLFLDDALIGQTTFDDVLAEGDETELGFGPLRSILLDRVVADRNEGDRGMISRQNIQSEQAVLRVDNRGEVPWEVRLRDWVPVSEQEDLSITWDARPNPTTQDIDGRRGVLEWRFELEPGATEEITLSHELRWPEGQELR